MTQFTPGSEWVLCNCNDKSHNGTRVIYDAHLGHYHKVYCKDDPREIRYVGADMLEKPPVTLRWADLSLLLNNPSQFELMGLLTYLCREHPEITEADIRKWRGF